MKKLIYNLFVICVNLVFSIVGIILTFPIMSILVLLIKLEDGGPVIFTQKRVGRDEKEIKIYKLRSMKVGSDKGNIRWTEQNDSRITKVGKLIRRTRLDEVPQLFNVLKGDMNLIGPRPEVPELTYRFNEEIKGFTDRLKIKPGLTGWAQINGGYDLTPRDKLKRDMYYIDNRNIMLDLKIIAKTFVIILTGSGAR
ncbi:Putative colanic biosynthesis UDP-glucose lipid carrier transferase [uncultured Clostridium sp.]|uniref:sugar transferase n=1 Tax=uncultured Clostridium sp. TaxID=59620 RepID=UPI000822A921|nr:sugar transferase [uncultured Clostridium sp.]SCJ39003.1 Putative colanic biosynthesis UDP-glucose lipid carrier transferase [uncultured Clostridium sp.]